MSLIDFLDLIRGQLGLMFWPLTVLSALLVLLVTERILFFLLNLRTNHRAIRASLYELELDDEQMLEAYYQKHRNDKNLLTKGLCMLIHHRHFDKSLREDAVSLWLQEKRRQFLGSVRVLQFIGVIAPLLGLLGTVLGLIEMFRGVAAIQGAVTPAQLADGLGLAMSTTAVGLCLAVPAITSAQLFTLWANRTIDSAEYVLNHFNLHLIGVSVEQSPCRATSSNESCPATTCSKRCDSEPQPTAAR
ncbi:MAG: MotA/TolQ/ExbB proton channel family protein [Ferrimonas sp.]